MSDDRNDERRATDDAVAETIDQLERVEAAKQKAAPGSPRHVELAETARRLADRLRTGTIAQEEIAHEQSREPRRPRES